MRGQVLPMWIGTVLMTLVVSLFMASYGNLIAWQFRAQSAADSAANAAVAIQSQEFNQMLAGLYASGVEEYRIRHLLEAMRVTSMSSGGCNTAGEIPCQQVWQGLTAAYEKSLYRYRQDVDFVSRVTTTMNYTNLNNDITQLISQLNTSGTQGSGSLCGTLNCTPGGDRFHFEVVKIIPRTGVKNARMDALNIVLPSYFNTGAWTGNSNVFAPVFVQVAVCVVVPPWFTWFNAAKGGGQNPNTVFATAAATNVMLEQDWLQPGTDQNPYTGNLYQPKEIFGSNDPLLPISWYDVDFGDTTASTAWNGGVSNSYIGGTVNSEEYLARTGWWGPVPTIPYFAQEAENDLRSECTGG